MLFHLIKTSRACGKVLLTKLLKVCQFKHILCSLYKSLSNQGCLAPLKAKLASTEQKSRICSGSGSMIIEALGFNADTGAPALEIYIPTRALSFLLSFEQRGLSAQAKECKLECKLQPQHPHMSQLMLPFAAQDLNEYLTLRATGLTRKTVTWLKKAAELFWYSTEGIVSVATTRRLRDYVLAKCIDTYAKRKVLGFARPFSDICRRFGLTNDILRLICFWSFHEL